ncbi:MAG: isochorismate synthase [bacterium]
MEIQQPHSWYAVFSRCPEEDFLNRFYLAAMTTALPIALWRLPHDDSAQALVDLSGSYKQTALDLEALPAGFVMAPFTHTARESFRLLEAHLFWNGAECTLSPALKHSPALIARGKRFLAAFVNANGRHRKATDGAQPDPNGRFAGQVFSVSSETTKQQYCLSVENAVEKIRNAQFEKVVLARRLDLHLPFEFEPLHLFRLLCRNYPNAFVSLVSIPGLGTWLGASPELLLSLTETQLVTVSLAGTQIPVSNSPVVWGEKELEEQAIVSDYIRDCFVKQSITGFTEIGPETMKIGELLHLRTKFCLRLSRNHGKQVASRLLTALHPTPAVCGVPKTESLDFIRECEAFEREFYAGYLGPVNLCSQTHLFVNLRCLQLQQQSAFLYAGAGITKDSVPEKEWLETELKLNSLKRFLSGAVVEPLTSSLHERELCG